MYNYATTDPHAPRIPKIYDSFGGHQGYIVMEFIDAPTVRECLQTDRDPPKYLYDKVAEAVKWLLFRPMPPSAQLAGSAQHLIFVDQVAPRPFVSAKGLEIYFNKHVGIYPRSFASLPFYVQSNGFVKAIVARVNYWRSPNIAAMQRMKLLLFRSFKGTYSIALRSAESEMRMYKSSDQLGYGAMLNTPGSAKSCATLVLGNKLAGVLIVGYPDVAFASVDEAVMGGKTSVDEARYTYAI
ncbi:hypothetical protein CPB85DRAFT_1253780 [Mucidula mucida]|nr:hypothetical protein CPB85DRAFT_1253780 [Mucidula mucida]